MLGIHKNRMLEDFPHASVSQDHSFDLLPKTTLSGLACTETMRLDSIITISFALVGLAGAATTYTTVYSYTNTCSPDYTFVYLTMDNGNVVKSIYQVCPVPEWHDSNAVIGAVAPNTGQADPCKTKPPRTYTITIDDPTGASTPTPTTLVTEKFTVNLKPKQALTFDPLG